MLPASTDRSVEPEHTRRPSHPSRRDADYNRGNRDQRTRWAMKDAVLDDRLPLPTDRAVDLLAASPKLREIVDSAAGLFDQEGYHRVSMEDIANAVGLRKPSLYHYVRSKDQILARIHHAFMDRVIQRQ